MAVVDFDVAIVGYGPVGQTLAALLGKAGHRVGVFERHKDIYHLPRAIRFDGEIMRLFQNLGIVADIEHEIVPADHYLWFGADGNLILDIDETQASPSGWYHSYVFYQPVIEAALDKAARCYPTVKIERGWTTEQLVQHEDHVELAVRQTSKTPSTADMRRVIRARYLVGADGANSLVRTACAIPQVDLGFAEKWIVADVRPHNMDDFRHLPIAAQYCNPQRPYTLVRNGSHHRRWEFLLLEGERTEDFSENATRVWQLLVPHIKPEQGVLIRHAVYEFRSLIAETMQSGRVFLAGDSAHQMPPFMAEGMCSGLRDANNLAWKLDLVLRGIVPDTLLTTYTSERRDQNEALVRVSMEMGKVSCVRDPATALARDEAFRSGKVPPPPRRPGLGDGVRHHPPYDKDPVAGYPAVQGRVTGTQGTGLTDDVVGTGFTVCCAVGDPLQLLNHESVAFLQEIGARMLTLDASVPGALLDVNGALSNWLTTHELEAVIIRPDYYAFGGVRSSSELPALVNDLRNQLQPIKATV